MAGSVQTGAGGFPEVGDAFTVSSTPSKRRVNVDAVLEPDEDQDGYGDVSQDLCPGSPAGNSACSGTLFGSNFEGNHGGSGGSGFDALYIQRTVRGASTAAPFDGVVVRWRVLTPTTSDYGIRVVGPTTGSSFKVLGSSATEHVAFGPSPVIGGVTTFQTRLPIPAGGYVGLATASMSQPESVFPSPGSTLAKLHDGSDGTVYNEPGAISTQELAYDADIEPDADHDVYGDITQDSCPSAATVHTGPCPPAATGSSSAAVSSQETDAPPAITSFKAVPARFRVKRGGAIVSKKRVAAGTKLKLTLSKAATVSFAVEEKALCKGAKGGKKCPPTFRVVHTFKRTLPQGASAVPYSGRYRKGGKIRTLGSAGFRVTALPSDATGLTGPPKRTSFAVAE